jgi:Xaa-Pro aminopeptidase
MLSAIQKLGHLREEVRVFEKRTYVRRRRLLKRQVGSGVVLFPGNAESPMNYPANDYPFRQDSSFLYFFGLDGAGLAGIIDLDADREILFGDDPGLEDVIWTGPRPPLAERAAAAGVRETAPSSKLGAFLRVALAKKRTVHYLPPYRAEVTAEIGSLTGVPFRKVRDGASVDLIRAVVVQRAVKSAEEIAEIETAVSIIRPAYLAAMHMAKPGRGETYVLGAMEGVMRSLGGSWAFPPIVTVNGHVFHNLGATNRLARGRMLLADTGVESPLHYACDITRTIPVGGRFNGRQRDIYEAVLFGQMTALRAIRPGVRFRDIHLATAAAIVSRLKDLKLMKGDGNEAVAKGAHALFFPHGLGHMLGLDVHDMEGLGETHVGYDGAVRRSEQFGLAYLRMARELRPGHVLTVEPGIYFIPALIDDWRAKGRFAEFIDYGRVERFRDFGGVRIEDDVVIMDRGCRVLGPPIPKTVADVEEASA